MVSNNISKWILRYLDFVRILFVFVRELRSLFWENIDRETEERKSNYYQMRKVIEFLKELQDLPPVEEYFSDSFKRSVSFSYLHVYRKRS